LSGVFASGMGDDRFMTARTECVFKPLIAPSGGDEEGVCGWLKDKYGLSWQIVPERVTELLAGKDRAKADRVMAAVMNMKKLDLAQLEQA